VVTQNPKSEIRTTSSFGFRISDFGFGQGVNKVPEQGRERRRFARHVVRRPLLAIPILPNGSPAWEQRRDGSSLDLSREGLGLELDCPDALPGPELVVVLQGADSLPACAGLEVRHSQRSGTSRLQIGGSFGGLARALLQPENLVPAFRPQTLEYAPALPDELLEKWAEVGILQSVVWDRVQLCPKCRGLPTFRRGCPNCGSSHLSQQRLIHHFACAHVGPLREFETNGELICPKCRTRQLIVSSDYEYLQGPYQCLECHWSTTELEHVGQCLRCGLRFPGHQAYEQEVRGYRVNELDPLAFLVASGTVAYAPDCPAVDRRAALCPDQDRPVLVGLRP
jgi:hypothetical protein